eukprot:66159-Rhodomonas_salina.2
MAVNTCFKSYRKDGKLFWNMAHFEPVRVVYGLGFQVSRFAFRVSGLGSRVWFLGFRNWALEAVKGLGFRV